MDFEKNLEQGSGESLKGKNIKEVAEELGIEVNPIKVEPIKEHKKLEISEVGKIEDIRRKYLKEKLENN
jgi:ribosomal protein L12E/L44/L45/RPP1/RPP2